MQLHAIYYTFFKTYTKYIKSGTMKKENSQAAVSNDTQFFKLFFFLNLDFYSGAAKIKGHFF